MQTNFKINPTQLFTTTTTTFQTHNYKSTIMATTDNNVVSKIPTNQSVITRLNAFLLALTTCALLFIALKIQTGEFK